jgi:hypothetical protein
MCNGLETNGRDVQFALGNRCFGAGEKRDGELLYNVQNV